MQREIEEDKERGRWLPNSSSPCWDAQPEQGAAHWDVGALLPGRRPVPALALYHRKLFLLPKLGRSWNIWWNSPTGHLCDKWIKLDKVMLTAIGLCMSRKSGNQTAPMFHSFSAYHAAIADCSDCHLFIRFWSNNRNSFKKHFVKLQRKNIS